MKKAIAVLVIGTLCGCETAGKGLGVATGVASMVGAGVLAAGGDYAGAQSILQQGQSALVTTQALYEEPTKQSTPSPAAQNPRTLRKANATESGGLPPIPAAASVAYGNDYGTGSEVMHGYGSVRSGGASLRSTPPALSFEDCSRSAIKERMDAYFDEASSQPSPDNISGDAKYLADLMSEALEKLDADCPGGHPELREEIVQFRDASLKTYDASTM